MSKIQQILNRGEVKISNGEKRYVINDFPNFPSTDNNLDYLFLLMNIQSIIFNENNISFPTRINKWSLDIIPNEINLSNNLFSYDGIRKVINRYKNDLFEKKIFIKFQILFESTELPIMRIHFFNFSKNGEIKISNESSLYPFIFFVYDENTFSSYRIERMKEVGINEKFIQLLPMINLCNVEFDNDGKLTPLKEIERYVNEW